MEELAMAVGVMVEEKNHRWEGIRFDVFVGLSWGLSISLAAIL